MVLLSKIRTQPFESFVHENFIDVKNNTIISTDNLKKHSFL
ncbi:hypothetical protein BARBAKC583_0518 [Bartonella bacilliformis KC583]|uniref:Uncharacterized protein n=1 Tax=Bartonella bacilliformis (strain ATCC 35685 / KC583 / Herrer 020/F12,63) TaxID=360095 RepID=A1US80_BARBK|nr:hypothetical protein BARBAKC583_0518 [Bartonella bacilliformis KC583]